MWPGLPLTFGSHVFCAPLDQYIGRLIDWRSTDVLADISTHTQPICGPNYRSTLSRYVNQDVSVDYRSSSGRCVGGQSTDMLVAMSTESGGLIVGRHVDPKATDILPLLHCYFCILVTVACRHNLTWVCCLIMTEFAAHDPNVKPSEIFEVDQKRVMGKCV